MDAFTRAYVECALFASTDEHGEPLDAVHSVDDLAPACLATMEADCADFQAANQADIDGVIGRCGVAEQAGRDFWLTRNRHGAGFWDRPDVYGAEAAKRLTDNAHVYGGCDLYVGDDGLIYIS